MRNMGTLPIAVCLLGIGLVAHGADSLGERIDASATAVEDRVLAWRHDIHEHPELSNREFRTSRLVADHLKSLGFEVDTEIAHTGVVGLLRGGKPGPVVALRADMDALPVGEDGGAGMMVREGVLTNPNVDAIFGLHVTQGWETGQVGFRPMGMMASAQRFDVRVTGRQTHAAQPWAGVDPIVVGAQIVMGLQTIVSRQIDLTAAPAIITVGTFHGGVRNNIIPDEVTMSGTIRTFDPEMRAQIHERMRKTVERIAESAGAKASLEISPGVPVTFNDPGLTEEMTRTLERVIGTDRVQHAPLITGAEDFSFFQEEIPGFFFFLGGRPPNVPRSEAIPNHSPYFYVEDAALLPGVRAMAHLAADYLKTHAEH